MSFKCNVSGCDKSYNLKSSLTRHQKIHTDIKHMCNVGDCKEYFSDKNSLNNHITKDHQNIEYKCEFPDCGKSYKLRNSLLRHQKGHDEANRIKCSQDGCDYSTTQKNDFRKHLRLHKERIKYTCEFKDCGKVYTLSENLIRHKKTHTQTEEIKCIYTDCKYVTKNPTYMKKHFKIHEGIKDYKCGHPGCNYNAVDSRNISRHRMAHTGEYRCYCDECGWPFRSLSDLKRHVESIHSGIISKYTKKEEKIIMDLLIDHNICFDRNVCINFSKFINGKKCAMLDFIIQTEHGLLIIEIDEHAHQTIRLVFDTHTNINTNCESDDNNYSISCEQARMLNVVASLRLSGETQPIAFLRYNPNYFKFNEIKTDISQEERSDTILNFIDAWIPRQNFEIHYYCYNSYTLDDETERVCVWDHKDFDPKLQECVFVI